MPKKPIPISRAKKTRPPNAKKGVAKTKQKGMFDRSIDDSDLEASLVEALDKLENEATKQLLADRRVAKKTLDDAMQLLKLRPNQRLRVGDYIVTGTARAGGGITVPTWSKTVPKISKAG